ASVAPALPGRWWKRVAAAATLNDPSWIFAVRSDGSVDRTRLLWSSLGQYVGWVAGTVVGVLLGPRIGSIETIGLDTVMPMFFVSLLVADLKTRRPDDRRGALRNAGAAALIALLLAPFAPAGVPVLVAVAVILLLVGRSRT
ncbi:MAG: AzlC family ABC transporter permease, partial [Patulibacter sp.]